MSISLAKILACFLVKLVRGRVHTWASRGTCLGGVGLFCLGAGAGAGGAKGSLFGWSWACSFKAFGKEVEMFSSFVLSASPCQAIRNLVSLGSTMYKYSNADDCLKVTFMECSF